MEKDYNYYLNKLNSNRKFDYIPLAEKQAYAMKRVASDRMNSMTSEEYSRHLDKVCKENGIKVADV